MIEIENQMRAALERATGHLGPPPDLLDRVRAGGRRRVIRRRAVLGAGLGVLAAGSAAGLLRPDQRRAPVPTDPFARPTRGDLSGDRAYLDRVRAVWTQTMGRHDQLLGEPHVVWAGRTPAGPAAVVQQRAVPPSGRPDRDKEGRAIIGMRGYLQPTPGGPSISGSVALLVDGRPPQGEAFMVGERREVLVLVDQAGPLELSRELRFDAEGRVDRRFEPVAFDDGAAVIPVGPQVPVPTIALRRGPHRPAVDHADDESRLGPRVQQLVRTLGATHDEPWDLSRHPELADPYGFHGRPDVRPWYIRGTTPGGRRFVVQTLVLDDRVRSFSFLDGPEPRLAEIYRESRDSPGVRVRLPAGQGVVVGVTGATLSYRAGSGDWLPIKGDSALLPAAATELRVSRRSGSAVIPLPL